MAELESYRRTIQRVLSEYAEDYPAIQGVETQLIFDPERDHYVLMQLGWKPNRLYFTILHVDIIGGKVCIQVDKTDRPIVRELIAAGVPRDHIVMGFHPPELRQYTEYAVA